MCPVLGGRSAIPSAGASPAMAFCALAPEPPLAGPLGGLSDWMARMESGLAEARAMREQVLDLELWRASVTREMVSMRNEMAELRAAVARQYLTQKEIEDLIAAASGDFLTRQNIEELISAHIARASAKIEELVVEVAREQAAGSGGGCGRSTEARARSGEAQRRSRSGPPSRPGGPSRPGSARGWKGLRSRFALSPPQARSSEVAQRVETDEAAESPLAPASAASPTGSSAPARFCVPL